ncbi:hypothetical protein [Desulfolutivibrio sp.]|uniref:hypothetical protein n=1 Tax=Desulfolutivibrio sp. TaxID=2773296 RepID=UPI002F9694A5
MWIDEKFHEAIDVAVSVGFDLQSIADKRQACDALYDYIQREIKNRSLFDEYDFSVEEWHSSYGLLKHTVGFSRNLRAPS